MPMRVGVPEVHETVQAVGLSYPQYINQIGVWTAIQHAIPGIFLPLIMVSVMTRYFGRRKSYREGLDIWPYAILAGLCFVVPYLAVALLLGPEFPSLLGGLMGLGILIPLTKIGFLTPKDFWDFPDKASWEENWSGSIDMQRKIGHVPISLFRAWVPYVLIGVLLVMTRVRALTIGGHSIGDWLKQFSLQYDNLLGTSINGDFDPLYNPGLVPFVLVALISVLILRMRAAQVKAAWGEAVRRIKNPLIALIFAVPMVRVMMQSGNNPQEIVGMPIAMAISMSEIFAGAWPLVDAFVGALGSFMSGSNTVSNMLFSMFQFSIARQLDISTTIIVSVQNIGGAMGNMICVHNVIAACATVGLAGVEGLIIRRNLLPMTIVGIAVGIVAVMLVYFIVPDMV